ncbi:hypothetical protein NDU88_000136 [Pleurodeles waltl]|uniref:Uncharacterized protein n=1 Tax=Pleurodeles waltl TaxID=8319 RepID=A0AAV7UT74_PLEWA|nr:hypothetical protein NDU88_000136 [Pleurodeles waltl]
MVLGVCKSEPQRMSRRILAVEVNGILKEKLRVPGWIGASAGVPFSVNSLFRSSSVLQEAQNCGTAGIRGSERPPQPNQMHDHKQPTVVRRAAPWYTQRDRGRATSHTSGAHK